MMKYLLIALPLIVLLNSCAVINSLMGWNKCAEPGCDREKEGNCNYCAFHCQSYYPPDGFNQKVGKSIDQQTQKAYRDYQKNKNYK